MPSGDVEPGSSRDVLRLVRRALEEFDERPLEVTVRRAVRIAALLGDTATAIRLALELTPIAGHRDANVADLQRLMAEPSSWGSPESVEAKALEYYMEDRRAGKQQDRFDSRSLSELDVAVEEMELLRGESASQTNTLAREFKMQVAKYRGLAAHRTFAALCSWERQLTYAGVHERIFLHFQRSIDALLTQTAPDLLDRFNAVYRALREAPTEATSAETSELLTHCVTTCRRILKAVVDHVEPADGASNDQGHATTDQQYRNRLRQFIKRQASDTASSLLIAAETGLDARFTAIDKLASKGVHADVARAEAEYCAINTYVLAGEILRVAAAAASA